MCMFVCTCKYRHFVFEKLNITSRLPVSQANIASQATLNVLSIRNLNITKVETL